MTFPRNCTSTGTCPCWSLGPTAQRHLEVVTNCNANGWFQRHTFPNPDHIDQCHDWWDWCNDTYSILNISTYTGDDLFAAWLVFALVAQWCSSVGCLVYLAPQTFTGSGLLCVWRHDFTWLLRNWFMGYWRLNYTCCGSDSWCFSYQTF